MENSIGKKMSQMGVEKQQKQLTKFESMYALLVYSRLWYLPYFLWKIGWDFLTSNTNLTIIIKWRKCQLNIQSSKWKCEFTGPSQILDFILYIYLNKNWKNYRLEQSFTGLGPKDQCSQWGLHLVLHIYINNYIDPLKTYNNLRFLLSFFPFLNILWWNLSHKNKIKIHALN